MGGNTLYLWLTAALVALLATYAANVAMTAGALWVEQHFDRMVSLHVWQPRPAGLLPSDLPPPTCRCRLPPPTARATDTAIAYRTATVTRPHSHTAAAAATATQPQSQPHSHTAKHPHTHTPTPTHPQPQPQHPPATAAPPFPGSRWRVYGARLLCLRCRQMKLETMILRLEAELAKAGGGGGAASREEGSGGGAGGGGLQYHPREPSVRVHEVDTSSMLFDESRFPFAMVSDLDRLSRDPNRFAWRSFYRSGVLVRDVGTGNYTIEWAGTPDRVLWSNTATKNRSMELSELVRYKHWLLGFCDITGLAFKIKGNGDLVLQR